MTSPLKEWVDRLKKDEMPVFGSVAVQVSKLSLEPNVSTSKLANVILQDPSMTAKVLRVGNSSLYPKLVNSNLCVLPPNLAAFFAQILEYSLVPFPIFSSLGPTELAQ